MREPGLIEIMPYMTYMGYLGPATCLFQAHCREWLQPGCWIIGIVLLPGCLRGSEIPF